MYNGNGSSFNRRPGIPAVYLYAAIGILALVLIWFVAGFFRAGIEGYFALVSGILLVLGNLRDLIANPYPQRSNTALLNTLIGGGLIFFFLGKGAFPPIGAIWYVPALILLLIAAPLMLGRASVYGMYLGAARNAFGSVRRTLGAWTTRVP